MFGRSYSCTASSARLQTIHRVDKISMGAGQIVQNNVKSATTAMWEKLPYLPHSQFLDFDLNAYNKPFVSFAVVVGIFALAKGSLALGRTLKNSLKSNKLPSDKQLSQKYGHHSWVLVADCKQNEQYCNFFAKNGFNLILMGEEKDITQAEDNALALNRAIQTKRMAVNWQEKQGDIGFYENLLKELQHFDVSFLVLPKLIQPKQNLPSHLEHIQPFEHIYLLVRFLGQKLKWRSYKSAIIFRSHPNNEQLTQHNGISKALIAGADAFGRIINFELKNSVEVVVARGSAENAIRGLGVEKITH